uniref:DYW domain-containing protein n=1 Tax=Davidia involucrata TaxID=16924 RepID=A0A5B6YZH4_DAVIN
MARKRVTLLTINSFIALTKVRSSHNSLGSIETVAFVKNLSTVTERSYFNNPDGFNGENDIEHPQNPSGFNSENQNHVEFQQKSNGQGLGQGQGHDWGYRGHNRDFQKNPDAFYRGNSVRVGQNTSAVHGQNPRNEFQQNPVAESGSFSDEYYRESPRNEFQQNPVGQNVNCSTGYYRESPRNEFQHNPFGQNGNVNGYNGENLGELQQNQSGYNAERAWNLQKSLNGLYGENMNVQNPYGSKGQEEVQQNPNGLYQQRVSESQGTVNGHFGKNTEQFGQSISDYYGGNTGMAQQNPSNYYTGNTGTSQQNPGNYHMGYTGMSQQIPGNNYTVNTGIYQQGPSGYHGVNVGSPDRYLRGNVENYQQNSSGNYNANIGQYQKSNESQNGMVGPHVSSTSEPDGESVEAAESGQYSGTIEELGGFCNEGKLKEAVEVLELLEKQHIPVDLPRYLTLMKACGDSKALQEAKSVHDHLMRSVYPLQVSTYNKILKMYAKCDSMDDAYMVFQKMPQRNLTSWDTMISWHANNGLGEDAIELFTKFKEAGLRPDGQMFIGVFSACKVLGDINEGMMHFESMSKNYGIFPSMEHYVSVVDMLGSTGYLDEALEFIEKMPMEPSVDVWETLMNLCRVHGNMELGDRYAELVELLDPSRLNEQSKAGLIPVKASDILKEKEKKKLAGQSLLEVRSKLLEYRAGDTSHPGSDKIYALLRGMKEQMKEAGYVPETKFVLHDIDQEGKEEALLAHSERLAVAQALISSPARSPIRIIKNLRVCGDCHNALKIIAKLVGREFIIRDAKRYHHFKDGLCSCRDYW